jgi:uroporphyrinogen decarboxylase
MLRRDLLERTFAGEVTPRVPVTFTRHWPGDDQRAADLARATVDFQRAYGWDCVQVFPASTFSVVDYGGQDEWQGSSTGDRTMVKVPIKRSLDWTELRTLDPSRGELGKISEAVRMVVNALRDDGVPVLVTVYSPLAQAVRLSGSSLVMRHLRTQPERLRTGLNVLTESLLRFIDLLKQIDIAGIVYVVEHADFEVMAEPEYVAFALPYDRKILDSLPPRWWLNVLNLRGSVPMFTLASTYPVRALCWNDTEERPGLGEARSLSRGTLMGGLSQHLLHFGTPSMVRDATRKAIQSVGRQRLILSCGEAIAPTTPISNLRAVREVADMAGGG